MTQHKARILRHLLNYGSITPAEAYQNFGCMRLAARIHDLRGEGFTISTTMVDAPNGSRYARYNMVNFKK